jgi:hypothetical protein
VPLCPPQTPHAARTRIRAVGSQPSNRLSYGTATSMRFNENPFVASRVVPCRQTWRSQYRHFSQLLVTTMPKNKPYTDLTSCNYCKKSFIPAEWRQGQSLCRGNDGCYSYRFMKIQNKLCVHSFSLSSCQLGYAIMPPPRVFIQIDKNTTPVSHIRTLQWFILRLHIQVRPSSGTPLSHI